MSKIALAAKSGFGLYFLKETGIGKTIEEKLAMFSHAHCFGPNIEILKCWCFLEIKFKITKI